MVTAVGTEQTAEGVTWRVFPCFETQSDTYHRMEKISFNVQGLDKVMSVSKLSGKGSLVDQVYWLLRNNIINLNLAPEMPLVEKEIAVNLEISKTPVREALIRLANDRLITIVPKSGSYVTPISLERYLEACFIRINLESGCVRRLAEKGISLVEEVKLKSLIAEQEQIIKKQSTHSEKGAKVDYSPIFALDESFHRTLFECAGIPGAWRLLDSAKAELDRVRYLKKMMGIHRGGAIIEEHTNIVQAIINKDPVRAEKTIKYHIGGIDDEIKSLSENPRLLQTMEEFNLLINAQRKGRNKRKWREKAVPYNNGE